MGGSYIWNRQPLINPAAARAFTSERRIKALLRKLADAETGSRNCRNSWAKKVRDNKAIRTRFDRAQRRGRATRIALTTNVAQDHEPLLATVSPS
jgi:hypothetical protein